MINCMPSTVLVGNVPYNVLFPKKSLFPMEPKVFASKCYVRDVRPYLSNIYPKALKFVFLGYSHLQKGYQCYYIEVGRYLVSTDVVFSETTFFCAPPIINNQGEEDEWLVYQVTHSVTKQSDDVALPSPTSSFEQDLTIMPSTSLVKPLIVYVL